jgi:hypothetical protein
MGLGNLACADRPHAHLHHRACGGHQRVEQAEQAHASRPDQQRKHLGAGNPDHNADNLRPANDRGRLEQPAVGGGFL